MRLFVAALLCLFVPGTAAQVPLEETRVHNHQPQLLPEGALTPRLQVQLYADETNGVNLQLIVENYDLEPPAGAGTAPDATIEGHAHIMINGKKRVRLYSEWIHLEKQMLRDGINQITVTLNSHDHRTWVIGNQPILTTVFFDLGKQPVVQHSFSSSPLTAGPITDT